MMKGLLVTWVTLSISVVPSFGFTKLDPHSKTRRWSKPPVSTIVEATSVPELDSQLIRDLLISGALGFLVDPVVEMFFNSTHMIKSLDQVKVQDTLLYGAANSVAISARVYGTICLYAAIRDSLDLPSPLSIDFREKAPDVAWTLWVALTVCTVKRVVLNQAVSGLRMGRVTIYNKLFDFVIALVTAVLILDELSINIGMGLQSLFAASGVGALVFSLASKDIGEQIIGGIVMKTWDVFEEGDSVKLGDGTEGVVQRIGLVDTEICGYDNIVITIPNSKLYGQRVSNISRIYQSQVLQKLRFKYSDIDKVPGILQDIKDEIQSTCPKLITDGSKPFRAVLSTYETDHIQTEVNCHFDISPGSSDYVTTREQVLLAIARAVEKNGVDFALPSINLRNK